MKQKMVILTTVCLATVCIALLLHERSNQNVMPPPAVVPASQPNSVANATKTALQSLLVDDYHSTDSRTAITSAIAHELIAEELRTNKLFLAWVTNVALMTVTQFVQNAGIPIYGSSQLTAADLKFRKVTVNAPVGLHAELVYDPTPSVEGPLTFIVEGGVHPIVEMVKNPYRTEMYQLYPTTSIHGKAVRNIGPMDWSGAVVPLNREEVDQISRKAFQAMTGMNLNSLNVQTKIDIEKFPNPYPVNQDATVTSNPKIKIRGSNDVVYPFAIIKYGDANSVRVPFFAEMVQTVPGRGEFVSLLAIVNQSPAIFELGEKFLGPDWQGGLLDRVNSMNQTERGEVYQRLFVR